MSTGTTIEWTHRPGTIPATMNAARMCNGEVFVDEKALLLPLRKQKSYTFAVGGALDLFDESVTEDVVDRHFAMFALCPQHTFIVLTRRPERMRAYMTGKARMNAGLQALGMCIDHSGIGLGRGIKLGAELGSEGRLVVWPLPNVWLGVSVEDQNSADERIPHLLQTPAAVRFLSMEPLLGPVDIKRWCWPVHPWWFAKYKTLEAAKASGDPDAWGLRRQALVWAGCSFIDWVIVGGESGRNARPMRTPWLVSIIRQCKEAGVPCFVKQLGGNIDEYDQGVMARESGKTIHDRKGGDWDEWPEQLRVRQFPEAR